MRTYLFLSLLCVLSLILQCHCYKKRQVTDCGSFTTCGECSMQADCGWCETSQECMNGDISGPTTCDLWFYNGCIELPSCSTFRSCEQCVEQPHCGYCNHANAQCLQGNIQGPKYAINCTTNWEFFSCPNSQCSDYKSCSQCLSATNTDCLWCDTDGRCKENSPTTNCEVPRVNECQPPTELESITIDQTRTYLTLQFQQATDRGGENPTKNCNEYFVNYNILGENPLCSWLDERTLSIRLGTTPTITFGQVLSLQPGVIRSLYSLNPITGGRQLSSPSTDLQPIIVGPETVSACDVEANAVLLSASLSVGGGPDGFEYLWKTDGDVQMDSTTSTQVLLGAATAPETLLVTLELRNFLGEIVDESWTITVTTQVVPQVLLIPPIPYNPLVGGAITAEIIPSECSTTDEPLQFNWAWDVPNCGEFPNVQDLLTTHSTLVLPPNSFQGLPNCLFTFTLELLQPTQILKPSTKIQITDPGALPLITGGTSRLIPRDSAFTLNASASQDLLDPHASLRYSFQCEKIHPIDSESSTDCLDSNGELLVPPTDSPQWTLGPGDLEIGHTYEFSVAVESSSSREIDIGRFRQRVSVEDEIGTSAITSEVFLQPWNRILGDQEVQLISSEPAQRLTWEVTPGDLDIELDPTRCVSIPSSKFITNGNRATWVNVALTTTDSEGRSGSSELLFNFGPSPKRGSPNLTPSSGDPYTTTFTFTFDSYVFPNPPITYRVALSNAECTPSSSTLLLGAPTHLNTFQFILPSGADDQYLCTYASDALGHQLDHHSQKITLVDSSPPSDLEDMLTERANTANQHSMTSLQLNLLVISLYHFDGRNSTPVFTALSPLLNTPQPHIVTNNLHVLQRIRDTTLERNETQTLSALLEITHMLVTRESASSEQIDLISSLSGNMISEIGTLLPPDDVMDLLDDLAALVTMQARDVICSGSTIVKDLGDVVIQFEKIPQNSVGRKFFGNGGVSLSIQTSEISADADVVIVAFLWKGNLFGSEGRMSLSDTLSVEVLRLDDAEKVIVEDLNDRVRIVFDREMTSGDGEVEECEFFANGEWSSEGCETDLTASSVTCECDHLSVFAVNAVTQQVPPTEPVTPSEPTPPVILHATSDDDDTVMIVLLVVLIIVCLLICCILIAICFFWWKYRRGRKKTLEVRENGTAKDYHDKPTYEVVHKDSSNKPPSGNTTTDGASTVDSPLFTGEEEETAHTIDHSSQPVTSSSRGPPESDSIYTTSVVREIHTSEESPSGYSSISYSDEDPYDTENSNDNSYTISQYYTDSQSLSASPVYSESQSPSYLSTGSGGSYDDFSSTSLDKQGAKMPVKQSSKALIKRGTHEGKEKKSSDDTSNPFETPFSSDATSQTKRKRFSSGLPQLPTQSDSDSYDSQLYESAPGTESEVSYIMSSSGSNDFSPSHSFGESDEVSGVLGSTQTSDRLVEKSTTEESSEVVNFSSDSVGKGHSEEPFSKDSTTSTSGNQSNTNDFNRRTTDSSVRDFAIQDVVDSSDISVEKSDDEDYSASSYNPGMDSGGSLSSSEEIERDTTEFTSGGGATGGTRTEGSTGMTGSAMSSELPSSGFAIEEGSSFESDSYLDDSVGPQSYSSSDLDASSSQE